MNQRGDLGAQKPVRKQTQSCWHKINKILSLFIYLFIYYYKQGAVGAHRVY